jgi:tetratricopeptide (TPR) repeat protein
MVLELLVKDWQEAGERSLALSLTAMTTSVSHGTAPSDPYAPLLERITRSLEPASETVLQLAAVLGHRLNAIRAYTAIGLTLTETMTGLTQLAAARVLRDVGSGLEFANELLRARAYLGTPSTVRTVLHSHVAAWLIANEGEKAGAGLEIAWHCVRGERVDEVPPYLLAGAREAVLRGGLLEAERSLTSARDLLSGADLASSQLLLAELLQEQGRWKDSMEALRSMSRADATARASMYRLLEINALWRLEWPPLPELEAMLVEVLAIHDQDKDASLRAHALQVAAGIVATLKTPGSAALVLSRARALHDLQMDDIDQARLTFAEAMTLYHARAMADSYAIICRGLARFEERHLTNSVVIQLHIGAGAIHLSQGNYEQASHHCTVASTKARRIGNEALSILARANRLLCDVRFGNYAVAISEAEQLIAAGALNAPGSAFQTVEGALFALAMLGRERDVTALIEKTGRLYSESKIPWMRQTWHLIAADALMLIGRLPAARKLARAGIWSDGWTELHGLQAPGPYARWLVDTAITSGERALADQRLREMLASVHLYDSVDRVDILSLALKRQDDELCRAAMHCELVHTPDAQRTQFVMLGVLPRTA